MKISADGEKYGFFFNPKERSTSRILSLYLLDMYFLRGKKKLPLVLGGEIIEGALFYYFNLLTKNE